MLHYWMYSWQAVTLVLTGLHKNQMDCLEFHTRDGWKNFHRLPHGCAHFKPYFSSIILILSIGNCRAYLYKTTSDPEPWQGGWIHTARGAGILRSFQVLFVWLTGTSLHITDCEPNSLCHIKLKWNTPYWKFLFLDLPNPYHSGIMKK